MVLSAIGIFMVVDSHTWTAFNFFGDVIPYNSFFMPMFMFISGYFNKVNGSTKLWPYTRKKLRSLLLPYTLIALLVFGLQFLIDWFKTGEVQGVPSWYLKYSLENIITTGVPVSLAIPMWFVITLFATLMIYAVMKRFLSGIWNSYIMFGLFTALNLTTVFIARSHELHWSLLPLKVMFFLPFIELGIIYRDRLEKYHEKISGGFKLGILVFLLIFNLIRTMYLPGSYDVAFDSLDDLTGFTSPYIVTPMISSLVGITFWLTLVDLIGKPIHESRFVNFMSCNTFWIMGLHITFFNILNCILLAINEHLVELKFFDAQAFRETEWYRWELSPSFKMVYVFAGVLGPLALKWVFDNIFRKKQG